MINKRRTSGFTLIELIVSVGLFAVIMTLVAGAYLVMINVNRQAQSLAIGIDNLAFALETMTRTIRTSTDYFCNPTGDCTNGTVFSVINSAGDTVEYKVSNLKIMQTTTDGGTSESDSVFITDPSVTISAINFYVSGTAPLSAGGNIVQPRVTIIVTGTVSYGTGAAKTVSFAIQTGATMRGSDL